jgi:hypothetical protein
LLIQQSSAPYAYKIHETNGRGSHENSRSETP